MSTADKYFVSLYATAQTHFMLNVVFYDQTDGVAMGSPLAPILANLLLGNHESNWHSEFNENPSVFYKCYVDEIIAIFENGEDSLKSVEYINSKHNNVKFTIEQEVDHQLAFLDVTNTSNKIKISAFIKNTFSGVVIDYFSFT